MRVDGVRVHEAFEFVAVGAAVDFDGDAEVAEGGYPDFCIGQWCSGDIGEGDSLSTGSGVMG